MTTSEPQAGRRDDDSQEHRSIGQRIRDAVLGEPDDTRPAPVAGGREPDTRYADARQGVGDRESTYTDADRGSGYADARQSVTDREATYTDPDRGVTARETTSADPDRGGVGERVAAFADPDRGSGDRATGPADTVRDDTRGDSDREYSSYEQAMREHVDSGAVPDPVRDDVRQDGTPGAGAERTTDGYGNDVRTGTGTRDAGARDDRDLVTGSYDPDRDTGYDPQAAGTAMTGTAAGQGTGADSRDFTTSSYDPDRDTGYDPQAAGTAMTGAAAGSTDVRDRDPRDSQGTREYDARDYDPATDTGYIDEGRAGADRTTGHRDADYDTGRVDTDRVDTDRDRDRHSGVAAGAAALAGGAAAAAGVAATHHRESSDRDQARFSEVDDTATVDATRTGRATPDGTSDTPADRRAEAVADEAQEADGSGERERLVPADRAHEYSSRWDALKGDFVDEPRRAVAQADDLVGELLDEIQRLFADQRRDLEQGFDHDRASTEDLRLALRRYRSFFDRLLSF